jgi:putative PIN family toxin of toxin-antitoxin system
VLPLRVVLDTNLLVSYLLTQGRTMARIIDYWESGNIVVVVSPALVEELTEVVQRPRLRRQMTVDPQLLIDLVSSDAVHTRGDLAFPGASRDPKDDKFLACAVEGEAAYLVSGDEDLLSLKHFQGISIVRPADFVRLVESGSF